VELLREAWPGSSILNTPPTSKPPSRRSGSLLPFCE
jgi:hypothetical protein